VSQVRKSVEDELTPVLRDGVEVGEKSGVLSQSGNRCQSSDSGETHRGWYERWRFDLVKKNRKVVGVGSLSYTVTYSFSDDVPDVVPTLAVPIFEAMGWFIFRSLSASVPSSCDATGLMLTAAFRVSWIASKSIIKSSMLKR